MNALQMKQKMDQKEMIGFDIGNSFIRVFFSNKMIVMFNSLLLQKGNAYINKKPTCDCLIDIPLLLSVKYDDKAFQEIKKCYNYTFKKGFNKNIIIKLSHETAADEFYPELSLLLMIKGIYNTNAHLKYLLTQKQIKMVTTVFEGEINSYRLSLSHCIKVIGVKDYCFVSTNNCIAVSYLKDIRKKRDETEIIGIIDFGDRGLTFSICKICSVEVGIVEVLRSEASQIGGNVLNGLLVDDIVEHLLKDKGMDVSKSPKIMHKLKILCAEAKHTLSHSQMAFIRLDGLPDILVYGCEISVAQFEKCISSAIKQNINLIKNAINSKSYKLSKIILNGGSCKIPYFMNMLTQEFKNIKLMECSQDWIKEGILQIKAGGVHILDVTSFELRIEGDEKYVNVAVCKGEPIPLRKKLIMKFPSGQLTYSMRFYQNNLLVASCHIPQRPSQSKYNLYVEVDHNKMLNIYATNTHGLIKMNCNMMEINGDEYIKYESLLTQIDFHNQND